MSARRVLYDASVQLLGVSGVDSELGPCISRAYAGVSYVRRPCLLSSELEIGTPVPPALGNVLGSLPGEPFVFDL